jgi:hypothetical protein
MRSLIVVVIALPFAIAGVLPSVAAECSIRDSALCVANPNCHWEYSERSCEAGPPPYQDGCVSHEAKDVCNSDTTLGCKWSDADNKCESSKK